MNGFTISLFAKKCETGLEPAKSKYGIFLLSDYSKGSGLEPENIDF